MSAHVWQKSSYSSEGGNCVNLAMAPDGNIRLRESDEPDVIVATTPGQLRRVLLAIKADRLVEPARSANP